MLNVQMSTAMKPDGAFKLANTWKDGTKQQIVAEKETEGLSDVIEFLRVNLEYFEREDLTFNENEIEQLDYRTWRVTFREIPGFKIKPKVPVDELEV